MSVIFSSALSELPQLTFTLLSQLELKLWRPVDMGLSRELKVTIATSTNNTSTGFLPRQDSFTSTDATLEVAFEVGRVVELVDERVK